MLSIAFISPTYGCPPTARGWDGQREGDPAGWDGSPIPAWGGCPWTGTEQLWEPSASFRGGHICALSLFVLTLQSDSQRSE